MTLDKVRMEIDEIDLQIKELFQKRIEVSEKVAEIKFKTGDGILKPDREDMVIQKLTDGMHEELRLEYASFLKKVMEVSRTHQYRKMLSLGHSFQLQFDEKEKKIDHICYQGLPCSYSEITANRMFPDKNNYPVDTFEEVFQEISRGSAEIGIVPLENTTAGGVYEVYDLLLKYNLYINYSYIIKIEHCLTGIENAVMGEIKEIYSHPQAIAQCNEFIKEKDFTAIECSNTAVAAKYIGEQKDPSKGAVCSREAAERYGLKVLLEGINHNKENATKFIAISDQLFVKPNHNRIAIVFACPHRSGSLASVLGIFGDYGVNLTEIHSRPDGKNPWEYLFYVDFTGNLKDVQIKALFYQLTEELPYVKILGSYEGINI